MFELSVACKYLRPRWRQLSVSIISLISILVIALVVWLIVVFFSVTYGLEKRWIDKLIALTAPVRLTPTEAYYKSYYYQIDSLSEKSNYNLKTIGEKSRSDLSDPYDPDSDVEIPSHWPKPDLESDGSLKDPVKKAFAILENIPGLKAHTYEASASNLRLRMLRFPKDAASPLTQSLLSQAVYLGSFDNENSGILKALKPITPQDIDNLLHSLSISSENTQEDQPSSADLVNQQALSQRLKTFFTYVNIQQLKTPPNGWMIPKHLQKYFSDQTKLDANTILTASLLQDSLDKVTHVRKVRFILTPEKNSEKISDSASLGYLQVAKAELKSHFDSPPHQAPFWIYSVKTNGESQVFLPSDVGLGEGILLPKPFRDAGVLLGDRGYISFQTPTASAMQEQRIKVFVAGFYDQGLIPIGGKFIFVNENVANLIGASQHDDRTQSNGINIRFEDLDRADEIKSQLQKAFQNAGIAPYWKIETFREYEFTKDIIQQLSSDKHLFSLIAAVIIIVACSNIISMLIILVNDKKLEIGILRSMGASSASIATIFGFCGVVMGISGSLIGIGAAIFTLSHLDALVNLLSAIQGHAAFNPIYYGDSLPNEVNIHTMVYVMSLTAFISLLSGLIPALKASMMRPSTILRAE